MRLIPKEIEVTENEGFTPEKDIFKRREFGERLTQLFERIEHPLVAVLDAPWGTGKTTFVKMWAGHLRSKGFPVVYFDAFVHDHIEDPFTAIAGEVVALARKQKPKKAAAKKFMDKATKLGGVLVKQAAKTTVKLITLNAVDGTEYDQIKDTLAEASSNTAEAFAQELVDQHQRIADLHSEFRIALQVVAQELGNKLKVEGQGESKPLIFLVDELDRCRPTFALELLEKVKHFFSVDSVHFVLVTNLKQLEQAVNMTYGGSDGYLYLQKFAHAVIKLPEEISTERYILHLFSSLNIAPEQRNLIAHVLTTIGDMKKFTLRQIERICVNIVLIYATAPQGRLPFAEVLTGLCILKAGAPDLYARLVSEQNNPSQNLREQIRTYLQIGDWPEEDSNFRDIFFNMLDYCFPHINIGGSFLGDVQRESRNLAIPSRTKALPKFINIMEATKLIELPPTSPERR